MEQYHDLYELFEHDPGAKKYFNNLPDDIRTQATRAGGLNSFDGLRRFAENLLAWRAD